MLAEGLRGGGVRRIPDRATAEQAARSLLTAVRLGAAPNGRPPLDAPALELLQPAMRHEQVESWVWHQVRSGHQALDTPVARELRGAMVEQTAAALRLGALARRVVQTLRDAGIASVLLKGAACHAVADRYPYFRHRPTGDVDLLVEPGAGERAWAVLHELGFPGWIPNKAKVHEDSQHLQALVGDGHVLIELHERASLSWTVEESWRRFFERGEDVAWRGTTVRVPSIDDLTWHAIAHSVGDGVPGYRLRAMLTVAALIDGHAQPDWELLRQRMSNDGIVRNDTRRRIHMRELRRWLASAAWLANRMVPTALRAAGNPERDLVALLSGRVRALAAASAGALSDEQAERRISESTHVEFGLGLGRLGYWTPPHLRARRLLSSAIHQAAYRLGIGR